MSIIIFIIVLGILIFVHEFGHFLAAKKTGMYVEEFAVGFKPAIWQKIKGETKYILGLIPVGGYVKIFGEDPEEFEKEENKEKKKRAFGAQNRFHQALVISMGVIFNIIFAWVLFSAALMIGAPTMKSNIDQKNTEIITVQLPFHKAVIKSIETTGTYLNLTTVGLIDFISNVVQGKADMDQVSGPIGIVKYVGQAAQNGFAAILIFTGIISINLAVINFLPFPALDGGRLVFIIIEAIIRRPIKTVIFNTVNFIGFGLLILLMIFVTYHDIVKIFF